MTTMSERLDRTIRAPVEKLRVVKFVSFGFLPLRERLLALELG